MIEKILVRLRREPVLVRQVIYGGVALIVTSLKPDVGAWLYIVAGAVLVAGGFDARGRVTPTDDNDN